MALDYYKYNHKKDNFTQLIAAANPNHYPTGITGYETYYTDMQGFWRNLYNPNAELYPIKESVVQLEFFEDGRYKYWNKNIIYAPESLEFWIDFLDSGSA